ncbi:MAG: PD-(D/E)XK nuclease family protein, partial [Thermomicrobiaceae bacterium]
VATTRAADYLVLPVAVVPDKAKGLMEKMIPYLPQLSDDTRGRDVGGVHVLDPTLLPQTRMESTGRAHPITDEEEQKAHASRIEWAATLEGLRGTGNAPRRVVTASSQKGWERTETGEAGVETAPVDAPVERNLALQIGNALHKAMEQIDLRRHTSLDETVQGLIDNAMDEAGIRRSDSVTRHLLIDMVGQVLGSDLIARARASEELVQEVEFGYGLPEDGGMVQGQMDLIFVEGNEIIVGDFKSDNVPPGQEQQRTESHYSGQAAVYAYAAHQVTGLTVREVIFYFARTGVAVSLAGDELVERGREIAFQAESQDMGYPLID